jgi:two-component system, NarL family, nitrate/nitrite response regulator NarL
MAGTITLAAIDRDRMLLDGLRAWLRAEPDLLLASTHPGVADFLAAGPVVDVVLLSLDAATAIALRRLPGRVLLVSPPAEGRAVVEKLAAALLAGAAGHVSRDRGLGALVDAVRAVAAGRSPGGAEPARGATPGGGGPGGGRPAGAGVPDAGFPAMGGALRLSRQERAVLLSYATGSTLQAAAHRAGVTYGTARGYLERVKRKYTEAGRPTYTKLDLATRLREDLTDQPLGRQP